MRDLEAMRRRAIKLWATTGDTQGLLAFADMLDEREHANYSDSALVRAVAASPEQDALICEWTVAFSWYPEKLYGTFPDFEVELTIAELRMACRRVGRAGCVVPYGFVRGYGMQVRTGGPYEAVFLRPLAPAPSEFYKDFDPDCCLAWTLEDGRLKEREVNYRKTVEKTKNAVKLDNSRSAAIDPDAENAEAASLALERLSVLGVSTRLTVRCRPGRVLHMNRLKSRIKRSGYGATWW